MAHKNTCINCCNAGEPEVSENSIRLISAVGSQKGNFRALLILVLRVLFMRNCSQIFLATTRALPFNTSEWYEVTRDDKPKFIQ